MMQHSAFSLPSSAHSLGAGRATAHSESFPHQSPRTFTLGLCAMDSKVQSAPMQSILRRLQKPGDFELVYFTESLILHKPVDEWPIVDCLMAFHSAGYPLEKVREYVRLVKPVVLNDVEAMRHLRSRVEVFRMLKNNGIPIPSYIVVNHDLAREKNHVFEEHYDYIVYNGLRLNKPFIEKPDDADNHNNYVYYPRNTGGGCKKLFRKVKDRSSAFYPDIHQVRRDGTYVYEEFLATFGTDVKVYTVGQIFAHAEARKAPTLDGKVQRTAHGKEVRYPVILTEAEKVMAYKIVEIFKQTVCGFDILRTTTGQPYVCDVNGWSFVKGNIKYYNDCAHIIRILFLTKLQEKYNFIPRELPEEGLSLEIEDDTLRKTFVHVDDDVIHPNDHNEELRTVVVVMRHGDRKPKQKLKFETSEPEILAYHQESSLLGLSTSATQPTSSPTTPYGTSPSPGSVAPSARKAVKLKSPEELLCLLEKTRAIIARVEAEVVRDCSADTKSNLESFIMLKSVLERGDGFTGINRKFQIKPVAWKEVELPSGEKTTVVVREMVVAKWGGELTRVGRAQAEDLGQRLRVAMYPGEDGGGLLRLHSTFRHDLKIYTSDEGRCQVTSAAFTKGFLDLEGELTPILVQMVVRNAKAHSLLDASPIHVEARENCKQLLDKVMNGNLSVEALPKHTRDILSYATGYAQALPYLKSPRKTMMQIQDHLSILLDALTAQINRFDAVIYPANGGRLLKENGKIDYCCGRPPSESNILRQCYGTQRPPEVFSADVDSRESLVHPLSCDAPAPAPALPTLTESPVVSRCASTESFKNTHMLNHAPGSESRVEPAIPLFCSSCRLIRLLSERLRDIRHRWEQLSDSWFDKKIKHFDSTKIPDIVDNIRYDLIHHHTHMGPAALKAAFSLYKLVEPLCNFIAPAEYGMTPHQKADIGTKLISRLLKKIMTDVTFSRQQSETQTSTQPGAMQPNLPRGQLEIIPPHGGSTPWSGMTTTKQCEDFRNLSRDTQRPAHSATPTGSSRKAADLKVCDVAESTMHTSGSVSATKAASAEFGSHPQQQKEAHCRELEIPESNASCPNGNAIRDVSEEDFWNGQASSSPASCPATASSSTVVINKGSLWGHQQRLPSREPTSTLSGNSGPDKQRVVSTAVVVSSGDAGGGIRSGVSDQSAFHGAQHVSQWLNSTPDGPAAGSRGGQLSVPSNANTPAILNGKPRDPTLGCILTEIVCGEERDVTRDDATTTALEEDRRDEVNEEQTQKAIPDDPGMDSEEARGEDDDDDDDTTSYFRLKEEEAKQMGIKSPWRIVRSRYYVASASHIMSLYNILMYGSSVLNETAPDIRLPTTELPVASSHDLQQKPGEVASSALDITNRTNAAFLGHGSGLASDGPLLNTAVATSGVPFPVSKGGGELQPEAPCASGGAFSLPTTLRGNTYLGPEQAPQLIDDDPVTTAELAKVTDVHYLSHIVFRVRQKREDDDYENLLLLSRWNLLGRSEKEASLLLACTSAQENHLSKLLSLKVATGRGLQMDDVFHHGEMMGLSEFGKNAASTTATQTGAKDGFGSNYALLRAHAQRKQSVFQRHLDHLLTHHVRRQTGSIVSNLCLRPQTDIITSKKITLGEPFDSNDIPQTSEDLNPPEGSRKESPPHEMLLSFGTSPICAHTMPSISATSLHLEDTVRLRVEKEKNATTLFSSRTTDAPGHILPYSADCESLVSEIEDDDVHFDPDELSCSAIAPHEASLRSKEEDGDTTQGHEEADTFQHTPTRVDSQLPVDIGPRDSEAVPPYCEINPLLRLTKNCSVASFEIVLQSLLRRLGPNPSWSSSASSSSVVAGTLPIKTRSPPSSTSDCNGVMGSIAPESCH